MFSASSILVAAELLASRSFYRDYSSIALGFITLIIFTCSGTVFVALIADSLSYLALNWIKSEFFRWSIFVKLSFGKVLDLVVISEIVGTDRDSSPEIMDSDSLGMLNVLRG